MILCFEFLRLLNEVEHEGLNLLMTVTRFHFQASTTILQSLGSHYAILRHGQVALVQLEENSNSRFHSTRSCSRAEPSRTTTGASSKLGALSSDTELQQCRSSTTPCDDLYISKDAARHLRVHPSSGGWGPCPPHRDPKKRREPKR